MNRREFLYSSLAVAGFSVLGFSSSNRPQVAITMDDFRWDGGILLAPGERNARILSELKEAKIQAALFVCGQYLVNDEGQTLLKKWDQAGHWIGNHTYSHQNYNAVSTEEFTADILKNENILKVYPNFQKLFRFPFLKEGDTVEKRDRLRSFLMEDGYRHGYVTIDTSDWYVHVRLQERLAKKPEADIAQYRAFYLRHLSDRADFYNSLSLRTLGKPVKHTLLLHHNELNGLFLGDVLRMFRDKGWDWIDAKDAFADPVFQTEPNIAPAGESIIWALAKETGKFETELRSPGEDGDYEKEAMDRLGL